MGEGVERLKTEPRVRECTMRVELRFSICTVHVICTVSIHDDQSHDPISCYGYITCFRSSPSGSITAQGHSSVKRTYAGSHVCPISRLQHMSSMVPSLLSSSLSTLKKTKP